MIEFIPETHTYLVDGVIVPSVTRIIRTVSGEDYSQVPPSVLDAKADYGTRVHAWLQAYFEKQPLPEITDMMKLSTDQVSELLESHDIETIYAEKAVNYGQRMAGTFDLLAKVDGLMTLIDHKTTAKFDKEYLEWQCGCYALCIMNTFGWEVKQCYCLWLPKGKKGELIRIHPKSAMEVEDLLKKYEANTKHSSAELPF